MEELVVKKNFNDVYTKKYPASYLEKMGSLDYRIPDQTKPLYKHLSERIGIYLKRPISILDLGSSYGINSALLNHELVMDELDEFFIKQNPQPSIKQVHNFFDELPNHNPNLKFYLVDISSQALEFAEKAGLCEGSFCVNLENEPLPKEFKTTLGDIDLVVATGCVGYIGWKSFEKMFEIFKSQNTFPIFAFSVLRMFHMDEIEKVFKKYGYEIIKTKIGPLRQRRFYNDEEQQKTVDLLKSRGLDTSSLEENGSYYANFFIAGHTKNKPVWMPWVQNLEDVFVPIQGV